MENVDTRNATVVFSGDKSTVVGRVLPAFVA